MPKDLTDVRSFFITEVFGWVILIMFYLIDFFALTSFLKYLLAKITH